MKKLIALIGCLLVTACGGMTSNVVSPKVAQNRAASDMECPAVTVQQVDATTWKATGCEKTATFKCWTSPGMGDGTCMRVPS
ncbi:MAG: hypothetical protein U0414_25135 [Polyangiaceae bacterium]